MLALGVTYGLIERSADDKHTKIRPIFKRLVFFYPVIDRWIPLEKSLNISLFIATLSNSISSYVWTTEKPNILRVNHGA
jgi:hypothetical protein